MSRFDALPSAVLEDERKLFPSFQTILNPGIEVLVATIFICMIASATNVLMVENGSAAHTLWTSFLSTKFLVTFSHYAVIKGIIISPGENYIYLLNSQNKVVAL